MLLCLITAFVFPCNAGIISCKVCQFTYSGDLQLRHTTELQKINTFLCISGAMVTAINCLCRCFELNPVARQCDLFAILEEVSSKLHYFFNW